MKNYPLIRKTMEAIEADPESHNQDHWGLKTACRTTMCFAGFASVIDGATPIWKPESEDNPERLEMVRVLPARGGTFAYETEEYAQEALRLSNREANHLFYDCVTLDDVREYVQHLLEQEASDA